MNEHPLPVGIVYLVGAGSGDPGLITVRGAELLARANVVVYDALANPALLKHCPNAEIIYVGKRAAAHSFTQEQINALLVEKGLAGRKVVRLKGGDPFVFGRGGEECEALFDAGVPFEVVPGVTAAIAAPAYAGIPVTHRDFNSSFTFLTGHEKEEDYKDDAAKARGSGAGSDVDWAVVAKLPCVAFYMGVKSLPRICKKLIEHGMDPQMPAATIRWGTRAQQQTVVGTITTLPDRVAQAKITAPAMTIIGRVVTLRDKMNWFEHRPLFGQRIIVTRTRQQSSDLSEQLAALGASIIEAATIEIGPAKDQAAIEAALSGRENWDWLIFTSGNGVTFTKQKLFEQGLDVRVFGNARIATVGQATADAVREELGLKVDLCPKEFVAEALADELGKQYQIKDKKFLMLRADIGRPMLGERLTKEGAKEVRDVAIYETRGADSLSQDVTEAIEQRQVDWITFTSSSTATNLCKLLGTDYANKLNGIKLASIGPITGATLRDLKLVTAVEADPHTIAGLVDAIMTSCQQTK